MRCLNAFLRSSLMATLLLGLTSGCSSNFKDFQDIFSIGKDATFKKYKLPPLKEKNNVFPEVTIAGQAVRPVVSTCRPTSTVSPSTKTDVAGVELAGGEIKEWPTVLMILPDTFELKPGSFCKDPLVQAFLGNGYSVARWYFQNSDDDIVATLDDWGSDTVDRALSAIAWLQSDRQLEVVGVMGYGAASIAALQVAQQKEGLKFAIAGNGIYDLEKALAQGIGPEIEALKGSDQRATDEEFLEKRSIAWDYMTLPKDVALYHGQLNQQVAAGHAESFRDNLQASEFRVHFELIKDQGHAIDPAVHQRYLDSLLKSWPAAPKK